jgi:ribosomal protein L40E
LNEAKKFFLAGMILGLVFVIIGFFLLGFSLVTHNFRYCFGGVIGIGVGGMILWKSVPAFTPIKQQIPAEQSCPYCGAIVGMDATVCEKCKQPLVDN